MATVAVERRWSVGALLYPVVRSLRTIAVGGMAGFVAALIGAGIGSRLVMRIVSLTAGHEHYGERTEADALVGQITLGGTAFLVLLGTFMGFAGGLLFLASRRWLPWQGWRLGLSFGTLLLLAFGPLTIDGENFDFAAFGFRTLNVLMFAALFLLFGVLIAPIFERLDRRVPAGPQRGIRHALWWVLLPVSALTLGFGLLILVGFTFGTHSLMGLLAVYLLIGAPLLAHSLARRLPALTVAAIVAAFPVVAGGALLAMQLQSIYLG